MKLDKSLIPNISNLIDAQASPPFDPNRDYSLPWFSGMDGIAWNEDAHRTRDDASRSFSRTRS